MTPNQNLRALWLVIQLVGGVASAHLAMGAVLARFAPESLSGWSLMTWPVLGALVQVGVDIGWPAILPYVVWLLTWWLVPGGPSRR